MKNINILCCDPGRHSAWIIGKYPEEKVPNLFSLYCNEKHFGATLHSFYDFASELAINDIHHIVYEEAYVRAVRASRMQFAMIGLLHLIGYQIGATMWSVHPSKIKKIATGKGNATKEEVIQSAKDFITDLTFKQQVNTSHEADVYWLYKYFTQSEEFMEYLQNEK